MTVRVTSYAGLELLERYLRTRRFNQLVREAFADLPRWGDFGVVVMVRVFVGLVIVGGRRLRHLAYVADDPIFQRFGNVRVVPTARTLSRWRRHFTMRTVTRFQALNVGRRAPAAAHAGAAHLDGRCGRRRRVDGVAGRTGGAGLQPGCLRRSLLIRPPLVVRTSMRAAATRPRQCRRSPQTRAE